MRKWRVGFSVGVLLSAVAVVPAVAADMVMPKKAPVIAPAPVARWAGFYIGAHGGYGWVDPTASFNPAGLANSIPDPALVVTSTSGAFDLSVRPRGGFGGLQLGYNWQAGNIVYGLEADVSFADIKGDASQNFSVVASDPDNLNFTGRFFLNQKVDYFGTVRGRLGWANDALFVFGSGGFAWGHVKTTMGVDNIVAESPANFPVGYPAALNQQVSSSKTQYGFAVGGGVEWMFAPNWIVRGEYLFIDLVSGGTSLSFPGASFTDTDVKMHLARAALSYRFAPR